ncbi:MAG: hypothetical protein HRT35_37595 [Algicola sp.]|nr:hypothetical protein [Algicola sp.]
MTKAELIERLKAESFDPEYFSLDGELPTMEGFCLDFIYGKWVVFYYERGMKRRRQEFLTEEEATDCLYRLVKQNSMYL